MEGAHPAGPFEPEEEKWRSLIISLPSLGDSTYSARQPC